jgi:hypothetical protein
VQYARWEHVALTSDMYMQLAVWCRSSRQCGTTVHAASTVIPVSNTKKNASQSVRSPAARRAVCSHRNKDAYVSAVSSVVLYSGDCCIQ